MIIRKNMVKVMCISVDFDLMVDIIINKVFLIGIFEEDSLIIILYKLVKLWYSNYIFFFVKLIFL